jgi:hypothetical protein
MSANHDQGEDSESAGPPPVEQTLSALEGFVKAQRKLFALGWATTDLAANMSPQVEAVARFTEIQKALAAQFTQSVNIRSLLEAQAVLASQATTSAAEPLVAAWAESARRAVDFVALGNAVQAALAFDIDGRVGDALHKFAGDLSESLRAATEGLVVEVSKVDFSSLRLKFDEAIPENLREEPFRCLEAVAVIGATEGIPLANVPGPQLARDLIAAGSFEERSQILQDRAPEVVRDCAHAVGKKFGPFAEQCAIAIRTYQDGHVAPAQSHAANIVDSILRTVFEGDATKKAKSKASKPFGELPFQLLAEHLALTPLLKVFDPWYPSQGRPIPRHFSRHATAHAAGHQGVFGPTQVLVAIMLASSLTIQFGRESVYA